MILLVDQQFINELVTTDLNELGLTISETGELSFADISALTASFGNDPYVITATYDITSTTSFSTNLFRIEVPEFRNDTIVEGDLIFTTATDVLNDPSVDYVTHDGDYIFTPTAHFSGATQISFKISDNAKDADNQDVPNIIDASKFLKVSPINDAPLISLPIDISDDYVRSSDLQNAFEIAPTKQA